MSPKDWGPPIWYFFHCMVENIKDDKFNIIGIQCFQMIRQICRVLPCQTCSNHASQFLITIKQNQIKSKNDLKNIIYIFHNYVNKKNNKQLFHVYDLDMYKNSNLINQIDQYKEIGDFLTYDSRTFMAEKIHNIKKNLKIIIFFLI